MQAINTIEKRVASLEMSEELRGQLLLIFEEEREKMRHFESKSDKGRPRKEKKTKPVCAKDIFQESMEDEELRSMAAEDIHSLKAYKFQVKQEKTEAKLAKEAEKEAKAEAKRIKEAEKEAKAEAKRIKDAEKEAKAEAKRIKDAEKEAKEEAKRAKEAEKVRKLEEQIKKLQERSSSPPKKRASSPKKSKKEQETQDALNPEDFNELFGYYEEENAEITEMTENLENANEDNEMTEIAENTNANEESKKESKDSKKSEKGKSKSKESKDSKESKKESKESKDSKKESKESKESKKESKESKDSKKEKSKDSKDKEIKKSEKESKESKDKDRFTHEGKTYILRNNYIFSETQLLGKLKEEKPDFYGERLKTEEDEFTAVKIEFLRVTIQYEVSSEVSDINYAIDVNCNLYDTDCDKIGTYNPVTHTIIMSNDEVDYESYDEA